METALNRAGSAFAVIVWRSTQNLTQAAGAARLGVSQPTISRLEAGTAPMTPNQILIIADDLGVDPGIILRLVASTEGTP